MGRYLSAEKLNRRMRQRARRNRRIREVKRFFTRVAGITTRYFSSLRNGATQPAK